MTKKHSGKTVSKKGKNIENQEIDIGFLGSFEEPAESRTIASRKRMHDKVNSDISKYLETGGKIRRIDSHVTADPPQRPTYQYGQRPI